MAIATYSTGTVSVAAGDTVIVGAGTIWSGVNARPGDDIVIAGHTVIVKDVTDTGHLMIDAWPYTSVTAGAAYEIVQRSPLRFAGGQAMADVSALVAALNSLGPIYNVPSIATVPDPSYGEDGQYAIQMTTGKWWLKSGGVWTLITAPLAGYGGTSATSLVIANTVTRVFTTQANLAYNGARVRAASAAAPANYMEGVCTYSGSTLTMTVDTIGGSGTNADWVFSIAGSPGALFTQSGTGAVTRPVQSKIGEIFSVTDFGAKGDGTTDNAAAFNAAILAAYTASVSVVSGFKGAAVYVPPSVAEYYIGSPVTLLKGISIFGEGGHSAIILANNTNAIALGGVAGFGRQTVRGLSFYGQNATAARSAISYLGSNDVATVICGVLIENNLFYNFDTAIQLRSIQGCLIRGNWGENINQGIAISGAVYNTRIHDNDFQYVAGGGTGGTTFTGLSLNSYNYTTAGGVLPPEGITVKDNQFFGFQIGIDADACDTLVIDNNNIVATVHGIKENNVTTLCTITNNNVEMHTSAALVGIWARPLSGLNTSHRTNIAFNTVQGVASGANTTTACYGIKINDTASNYQDDVHVLDNFVKNMNVYDIAVFNPGGNTKVLNNKCLSTGGANSILSGTPRSGSVFELHGNTCAMSIDYTSLADLTTGATRSSENVTSVGTEASTWNLTSGAAAFMTFAGPSSGRRTFTLPNADATLLYSGGALGTPASGILTNATGLPVATGISGLGTGIATALGVAAGGANGLATLDGSGKLTSGQIPASLVGAVVYQGTWNATTNTPTLVSSTGTKGFYYKVATAGTTSIDGISQWSIGDTIIFDGTTWDKIDGVANEVLSVAGLFGVITSAALKTALAFVVGDLTDASANARSFMQAANYAAMKVLLAIGVADVTGAAPLASPALTGTPSAPNAAVDTNTTQIATTAMVLGQAASATPMANGTATVGTSTRYARADHAHPTDTHMGVMVASVTGVNFNSANTDTAIPIVLPAGFTRFSVFRVNIGHASQALTTSTFGTFSTTGGGGLAIISGGTVNTVSSASDATLNNEQTIAGNAGTMVAASLPTPNTIYFRVGTAQGAAATADVVIYYLPAP